ncbi:autotransporter domain-containing protein [Phyllobacterium sp. YR531]|uniref:autotransporter domain-containing protein n=1 Tax=Phyllobacterium sp. YR531 TaxID=1144343 RepID=UPI00026F52AE|nr:autotransporter domain-containing protein [Phyllobacterium sp. YR531]EJN02483.1 outer membrane autotransporter barrel domain-containing protein [Phyllobacterium sp. YR531]
MIAYGMKKNSTLGRLMLGVSAASLLAFATPASSQEANHSVKFMAFNIWNLGENSKIWDQAQKQAGKLVYSEAMQKLLRDVSPDVLVLPELNNNDKLFKGQNVADAFSSNTLDVLNSIPRKQQSFTTAQKNPDEGGKGSGSIFSSVPFDNLPGDEIRIKPGNGFPDTIVNSVHMNYYDEPDNRINEARELVSAGAESAIPTVILGDFNAGDVSERGLHSIDQQILLIKGVGQNPLYRKLAYEYLALADENKYRQAIQDEFPGRNIDSLSWAQWGQALENGLKSGKDIGLQDELYPVLSNTPVTLNILKKQYQLFQLERNREQFQPSTVGDGRSTWTSDGEDATNIWKSWDRVTIDHIMMSRPFAKWAEIADSGDYTGNLSDNAHLPSGGSLSDHEPVAQELRWIGPQLQTYQDKGAEKTRLVWGKDAYKFAERNKEFHLTRNNNRNDIYLGQIADADGNPILAGLTLEEKQTLLDCKSSDERFQQAIKDYCIDDHSFIGETLVKDGGTIIIDEDAALGGSQAALRLANGGLKVAGQTMDSIDRRILLDQAGWIDIADAGNVVSVDQEISGVGSFTKKGAGTLVFSAANSYDGGTFVEDGVLQSAIEGGFIDNTIYSVDGGTLDLNGFDLTASVFSGKGGKVDLGDGSLTINQAVNTRYNGAIEGTGGLIKSGAGGLVLNGQNSYSGATLVKEGSLVVGDSEHPEASLASNVALDEGTTLGGSGTLGGLTVGSGAVLSPGNSIGTLDITGNLLMERGSRYALEISGDGTSDLTRVGGIAHINGGDVVVAALDPETSYQDGKKYTILTAQGGVNGAFNRAITQSAFLDLDLTYGSKDVKLNIGLKGVNPEPEPPVVEPEPEPPVVEPEPEPETPVVFEATAISDNQIATARALDTLDQSGSSLALYNRLLVLNEGDSRTAYDALSGEIHASLKGALIDESHFARDAVNDRIRAAFGDAGSPSAPVLSYGPDGAQSVQADTDRFAVWGRAYGAWGSADGNNNSVKLERDAGGLFIGGDAAINEIWRVGALAGYGNSSFDAKGRSSSADIDSYTVAAYAGAKVRDLGLRFGVAHSWHSIDVSRNIEFTGLADHASSSYDARSLQVFGEASYTFHAGQASFEPFAGIAYVNLRTDGYDENGIAGLHGNRDKSDVTYTTLGLRASTPVELGNMTGSLNGTLGWRHAFGDVEPTAAHAFNGSEAFAVDGAPIDKDTALVEAGFDWNISSATKLGISYQGQIGNDAQQHGFNARLGIAF